MKKFAFRTLSIILAAVLLVAALPLAAFAEDDTCLRAPDGNHDYLLFDSWYGYEWFSNEEHYKTLYISQICTNCGDKKPFGSGLPQLEDHVIDSSVDPEVDMQGLCTLCEEMIYW